MKHRMTQELLDCVRELQRDGLTYIQISKKLDISESMACNWCVGAYKNKMSMYVDPCTWTPAQEMKLKHRYSLLPKNYKNSRDFKELCIELEKSELSVCSKIYAMGLKGTFKESFVPDPPRAPIKRPPAVYTNSRSPFGIGDELHAGNRIYK
jgi:hypothetical protein